jgi:AraC-like DNA-binding protein
VASSGKAAPTAVHAHAALAFVTSGRAVIEQRGRFEVQPGDVLIVPAGESHRFHRGSRLTAFGVGFCAPCYAPSELATLLDPFERARAGASPVVRIPAERREHLTGLITELGAESESLQPHASLVQKSLLALILAEITRAATVATATDILPSVVAEALRFIERHCLEPISLSDVAGAVHRSPAYVTTALKQATGRTAVEWIIEGRLAEGRNRLIHSDEIVEIIAERVGYADATHFIRLFRRAHGVTPAVWRAEHRQKREPERAAH